MQCSLTEAQLIESGVMLPNTDSLLRLRSFYQELVSVAKLMPARLEGIAENRQSISTKLIINDLLPLFVDVLTAEPHTFLAEKKSSRRVLARQAESLLRQNLHTPITLTNLCQSLSKSQRSLYYAFQECYGVPPMQYLKILRLNGVYRKLQSTEPTKTRVTEVATDWGFWHLGQFSRDYRNMFGESPSTTLRRDSKPR